MRRALILSALLVSGCPWEETDVPDTTDTDLDTETESETDSACPAGMQEPDAIQVSLTAVNLNSVGIQPTFVDDAVYDGGAAACVSADGLSMRLLLYGNGVPFAWWTSTVEGIGQQTLGSHGTAQFNAFGHDPATNFNDASWTSGIWSVTENKPSYTHTLNAQAATNGQFLVVQISAEVTL